MPSGLGESMLCFSCASVIRTPPLLYYETTSIKCCPLVKCGSFVFFFARKKQKKERKKYDFWSLASYECDMPPAHDEKQKSKTAQHRAQQRSTTGVAADVAVADVLTYHTSKYDMAGTRYKY